MFSIDKSEFGSFVSRLRKEKGITQKELARKLYVSDKAVSKWETGQSIPDVALLVPLAEILGVTVTELLECHRIENPQPIPAEDVETIVKKAVSYQKTEKRKLNTKWLIPYIICAAIALAQIWYMKYVFAYDALMANTVVPHIMSVIFGAYFCLFAKQELPAFYDENRLSFMSDGIFRMNIPGVNFNNSNWPNMVGYIRLWCLLCMVFLPLFFIVCYNVIINGMIEIGLYSDGAVYSAVTMFSFCFIVITLFVPVCFIAKKYE